MHYVYVLQSLKDGRTYIGSTDNVERRFHEHNSGRAKSTRHRAPFKMLFVEEFETSPLAKKREMWWKSGAGRRKLKEYFQQANLNSFP
jgi:putative endonuclease